MVRTTWNTRRSTRVVTSESDSRSSALAHRLLEAVDDGVTNRWAPARQRAMATTSSTVEGRVVEVTSAFRRELGAAGAIAGGTSAVPGLGTAAMSATFALELGWSTVRLTDMILTIAVLHGHHTTSIEERRLWVLSILSYGDGAASMLTRLVGEVGRSSGRQVTSHIPAETARQLNKAIGQSIVTKYGTKRGAMALGRAIPFGFGAAIGYGLNSYVVKATARHADAFFSNLSVHVDSIDTTATEGS